MHKWEKTLNNPSRRGSTVNSKTMLTGFYKQEFINIKTTPTCLTRQDILLTSYTNIVYHIVLGAYLNTDLLKVQQIISTSSKIDPHSMMRNRLLEKNSWFGFQ
eukprot:4343214-Ditylum_brightwellii.AAC.1